MSLFKAVPINNCLLDTLPRIDCEQLLANCEQINLFCSEVLYRSGGPVTYVYFPTGSFISLVTPVNGRAGLEAGLIGNEGILGISLMLGIDVAPFHAVVQGAGPALRIAATSFLSELDQSTALQQALNRYFYVSIGQLAQTAACTRYHRLENRLARWLLMTQDRAHSDHFHVTHALLAYLLGVRREGITQVAHSLQKQKIISYQRGHMTILDRGGLETASCRCYQADREVYDRLLGYSNTISNF